MTATAGDSIAGDVQVVLTTGTARRPSCPGISWSSKGRGRSGIVEDAASV